jgi:hypothetical protein
MKNILLLLAGLSYGLAVSSCEYHNEETLYPMVCDTTMITYSLSVAPIIAQNCLNPECHGSDALQSGIPLEGYDNVKATVDNERLLGSIRWESGFSFMPKNSDKLSDCDIHKIELWVADGAPNN